MNRYKILIEDQETGDVESCEAESMFLGFSTGGGDSDHFKITVCGKFDDAHICKIAMLLFRCGKEIEENIANSKELQRLVPLMKAFCEQQEDDHADQPY